MKEAREFIMKCVFILTACVSIAAVVLICIFMFANGIPAIAKIGPLNFLLGEKWKPMNNIFGILPMIVGSIYVTAGAIIIGVPIAFFASVYLAKFCNEKLYKNETGSRTDGRNPIYRLRILWSGSNCSDHAKTHGGSGKVFLQHRYCWKYDSAHRDRCGRKHIRAVPDSYYEGALALGAARERSVFFAVLPGAKSGILAGVVLGIGRAIGETMAVIMVAGNQPVIPGNLAMGVRTLTSNIVMEMGYATDLHREALIATAVVLFVLILIINLCCSALQRRSGQ